MARLQAQRLEIALMVKGTLEEVRKQHVALAKREHAKIMGAAPRPSGFRRSVDGRQGALEESVKPKGLIVYEYSRLAEVAQYAMEVLFDLSPVLSGAYRNAHRLFLDGVAVNDLKGWAPGHEVSISNTMPYARKIEVGRMKMRIGGSREVYQQARRKVMARYGNLAKVTFTYRAVVDGRGVNQQLAASSGQSWWLGGAAPRPATGAFEKTLGKTQHNRAELRFPALILAER